MTKSLLSESVYPININNSSLSPATCPPSQLLNETNIGQTQSPDEVVSLVEEEFQLNYKQKIAFKIIATNFLQRFVLNDLSEKPLKMLMTGPGGTEKTHVVKALQKVMQFYGSVAAAQSWCFAIFVNKFCKIMKIFEKLDHLKSWWVLCQH